MYDWPELRPATDALWDAIAGRLRNAGFAAPVSLDRSRSVDEVWHDPGLVLSQTCGFPFATRLAGAVRLVATPVYAVEGCDGPYYSSALVSRREGAGRALADFVGRRIAFNAIDSMSGYVALVADMRAEGLNPDAFDWVETGDHRASVLAVSDKRADLAAIDAVCWAHAGRFEADAVAQLKPIGWTPHRPALPFITAGARGDDDVAAIRAALAAALESRETRDARDVLRLGGVTVLTEADYAPLADLMR